MSNEKNIKSQATFWHIQGHNLKKSQILKPTRSASCDFTRILFPFRMIVRQWLIYVVIFISTSGQDKLLLSITLIPFYQNFFPQHLKLDLLLFYFIYMFHRYLWTGPRTTSTPNHPRYIFSLSIKYEINCSHSNTLY